MTYSHAIPEGWNIDWIVSKAQLFVQFNYSVSDSANPGFGKLTYNGTEEQFDAMSRVLETYPAAYADEVLKPALLIALADKRYAMQVAMPYSGVTLPCDQTTISTIAAKVLVMDKAGQTDGSFNWKVPGDPTTWLTLTYDELVALGTAINDHIQACFDNEKALFDAITAAEDVDAVQAIDIGSGWPN